MKESRFAAWTRRLGIAPQLALLIAVMVVLVLLGATPLTEASLASVMIGLAYVGPVALGAGILLILGEFDLSVGAVAALGAVLAALCSGLGFWPAILISLGACLLFGLAQGTLIARARLNSLMVTLGTSILVLGIAQIPSNSAAIVVADLSITEFLTQSWWIFSPASIVTIALFVAAAVFLRYHRTGRTLYGLGGGRSEARSAGLPRGRYVIVGFGFSGLMAGLTGATTTMTSGSALPSSFNVLLIQALTAVLIGGVAMSGGRGSVMGVLVGVLVIQVLVGGMAMLAIPYFQVNLAQGILLFAFIVAQTVAAYLRGRRAPSLPASRFRLRMTS